MSWFTDLERRGYRKPTTLRREIRRLLLIPRARRVKFEREMADLMTYINAIRPPTWHDRPRSYADEVE